MEYEYVVTFTLKQRFATFVMAWLSYDKVGWKLAFVFCTTVLFRWLGTVDYNLRYIAHME